MKDWTRHAKALDMHLDGAKLDDIGREFGVTRERARQIVSEAKQRLAYRVFKGLPRPSSYSQRQREARQRREWQEAYVRLHTSTERADERMVGVYQAPGIADISHT